MLRISVPALRGARVVLGAVLTAGVLAACGPVLYAGDISRAADAVDQARAAQADVLAPYWWTRAVEYLHQAREVAAHADFAGASRFGRIAADAAIRAASEARHAAHVPVSPPPGGPAAAPARPTTAPTEAPIAPSRDLPPVRDRP